MPRRPMPKRVLAMFHGGPGQWRGQVRTCLVELEQFVQLRVPPHPSLELPAPAGGEHVLLYRAQAHRDGAPHYQFVGVAA